MSMRHLGIWAVRTSFLVVWTALLPISTPAQPVPWILPWDDAYPGVATDFSDLNRPIGTNWVTAGTNGHFTVQGERIRFLGVNFAGDSPFALTNYAEGMAGRLAKYGVNSVRFHHMDASWAFNGSLLAYTSTTSTNLNPTQLERLHYMVARLKAHGIYSDINLLVGRQYRSQDGLGPEVATMDWKDSHILGFFYPPAMALQKDYATKLLAPTNRFTGLPLAQDPAVAFVEIINEHGIIQNWYDGGLDRLPTRYATNLQARWNTWLANRYPNTTQMLAAWQAISQPLGTNLVANGAFSNGLTGWNLEQHNAAKAGFARTYDFTGGRPSLQITVTNTDTQGWYIQANHAGLRVTSNQAYTISFWAKASAATNGSSSVMQAHDPWQNLGYSQTLSLTTNWQLFTNTFAVTSSDSNARVGFSDMGNKRITFWFADVRMQAGGQLGVPPAGTSLEARNIPNIPRSGGEFKGTLDTRRDWLRFLRDLEQAYYAEMAGHLRTNLRYPGLIFGTIMANSPATIQTTMDVIDSHAYWKHPVFPGNPWDSVNWYVDNVSMVNSLDNTLSGIGRQRIKGKPFVCTEYQHPSPNHYGAEGPLMLAAYAGLQDWDGLWLFDYGHGNPSGSLGYVSSFFQMSQHPTKMANLLLAANLFRRGDVRLANQEFTVALTPDREIDLLLNAGAWNVFSGSQLNMPGKLVFASRVSTAVGPGAMGLPGPPPAPSGESLTSDTGELNWTALQSTNGLLTFNTPRTKGFAGFADERLIRFGGGIEARPGRTRLGWSTLGLTLRRGEVFTNDCNALIIATGWWENTGQTWKDAAKNSVGNQWGRSPVLTEVVPFSLTLPVSTNYVRVWALNERGQRKAALPVGGDSQKTVLTVNTNAGTIWYELEVSRWTASYQLWRSRNFSLAEQSRTDISGPTARPFGGRLPNLLKYYHGLGAASVPPGDITRAHLLTMDGADYLAMTFDRDKLVSDVMCTPEISSNLFQWFSGPTFAKVESVLPLGEFERVTVRDARPLDGSSHYLRLRFDWQ